MGTATDDFPVFLQIFTVKAKLDSLVCLALFHFLPFLALPNEQTLFLFFLRLLPSHFTHLYIQLYILKSSTAFGGFLFLGSV